ncbi:MAG TPA: bifunctional oligoribonuclease/PAP phosphatase NrnA [Candidatus Butyricicoccus stercorigallinarum]|nr:bifunctional oligoribonuclease/PAP phosphatase NrnA [Candidatus Butyricicoccus stercorigallinarum]
MIGTVARAAAVLRSAEDILILTHRRPDGDTVGSANALCLALRKLGKKAFLAPNSEITRRYVRLLAPYAPYEGFAPRFVVTVDCADRTMIPADMAQYAQHIDLVIDHHRSNEGFGAENLVMGQRASCAEIVCDVIEEMGVALDSSIAEGIYIGASTDTGCFKFSNTTANTHRVAAKCLDAGVDGGEINRALFETKSRARYEIEGMLFSSMRFYRDGKIAVALITREARQKTGADWDDLDAIAGVPRQIEGVEVGLTLTELENGDTKVSVRTTKEVDASAICALVGGGGHLRAAGATLHCDSAEAIRRMIEATERVYAGETA